MVQPAVHRLASPGRGLPTFRECASRPHDHRAGVDLVAQEWCLTAYRAGSKGLEPFDMEGFARASIPCVTTEKSVTCYRRCLSKFHSSSSNQRSLATKLSLASCGSEPLDDCLCRSVDGADPLSDMPSLGDSRPDRKGGAAISAFGDRSPGATPCEVVGQHIKAGPQIVNTVPNQEGELGRCRLLGPNAQDLAAGTRLVLDDEGVRISFEPPLRGLIQGLQVFERPLYLEFVSRLAGVAR